MLNYFLGNFLIIKQIENRTRMTQMLCNADKTDFILKIRFIRVAKHQPNPRSVFSIVLKIKLQQIQYCSLFIVNCSLLNISNFIF